LNVLPADPSAADAIVASRRAVTMAVLGLMGLVIAAAVFLVSCAVRREVGVAQLQSDFLAAVSHEFRTPLAAMSHLTEVLEEQRGQPGREAEYYRALAHETRRLHGLVESLLDFGRTEAGRRVYASDALDVASIVSTTVAEMRERAGLSADRIALRMPATACTVLGDGEALALVVRNLVDNALKYSPVDSTVRVTGTCNADRVEVSVEDSGPGIPRAEHRTVFRKFVRGAAARDMAVKGTGIGLTMAMHVVRAHGGKLTLSSEPGRGSRFTVSLPRHTAVQPASMVTNHL
jgi:signal transduction histidine kinase